MKLTDTFIAKPPPLHLDSSGVIRVGRTRVTLDSIVIAYGTGMTAEEIACAYDVLSVAQVHAVLSYYLDYRATVDEYLAVRQRNHQALYRELAADSPWSVLRERSISRHKSVGGRPK